MTTLYICQAYYHMYLTYIMLLNNYPWYISDGRLLNKLSILQVLTDLYL